MKKRCAILLTLLFTLSLGGCSWIDTITGRSAREAQVLYDGLYNQLVSATTFDSSVTDYNLTLDVNENSDTYTMTLTIDSPRIAMRNVEVMLIDSMALSDQDQGVILTRGLMDEIIHLVPNQFYPDLNALESVSVESTFTALPQTIRVMVSYMDESGSTTYKQFFLFEIDAVGTQTYAPQ